MRVGAKARRCGPRPGLTAKEAAALEYADAFARLFGERYPHRRPLYLAPANEAGVCKLARRSAQRPCRTWAACGTRVWLPAVHARDCVHARAGNPGRRPACGIVLASSYSP